LGHTTFYTLLGGGAGTTASPLMGNTIVVDQINGNDVTGTVNGLPFQTDRSATGLGGSGVATPMTITVSDLATTGINLTAAVTINAGEYIALRADRSAAGATDIAVQLDLY
jgi:hypothetical protein